MLANHLRPYSQKEINTAEIRPDIAPKIKPAPFLPQRDIPPATLEQILRDLSDPKKEPAEISGLDFRSHWNLIALTILFPETKFPQKFLKKNRHDIAREVEQNRKKPQEINPILCQSMGILAYKLEYQKLTPDLGLKSKYLKHLQEKLNSIIAGNDGIGWDEIVFMIKILFPESSAEYIFPKNIDQLTFRNNEKILSIIDNFRTNEWWDLLARKAATTKLIYPEQFSQKIELEDREWQKMKLEMENYKKRRAWCDFLNMAMNLAILGADEIINTETRFALVFKQAENTSGPAELPLPKLKLPFNLPN